MVKISGYDMFKTGRLKQAANRAMQAGKFEEAISAWKAALAIKPFESEFQRGLLRSCLGEKSFKANRELAVSKAFSFLESTATNQLDRELAIEVLAKYGLDDAIDRLLSLQEQPLNQALESLYLKTLFNTGQFTRYDQRWTQTGRQFSADAELGLYRAAYEAGWGPAEKIAEARKQLERAQSAPPSQLLAARLQMALRLKENDLKGFEAAFVSLVERDADRPTDHANYWQLLRTSGHRDQAIRLAQAFSAPLCFAEETDRVARALVELELRPLARQLLKRYAGQFRGAEALWRNYAALLLQDRSWPELLTWANQMRQDPSNQGLLAYSHYLEGQAELALQHRELAQAAFQKTADSPFPDPAQGFAIAADLLHSGFPSESGRILEGLRKPLADNIIYWQLVMACARQLKQPERSLEAAASLYRLMPDDLGATRDYATNLIALRRQPEIAVKLTAQLIQKQPSLSAAKINHSLAWLLSEHPTEAENLLNTVDAGKLMAQEATAYYFAWYQVWLNRKDYRQARHISAFIDPQFLSPTESQWLADSRQRIPATKEN